MIWMRQPMQLSQALRFDCSLHHQVPLHGMLDPEAF
jgi:hypothetical protein